MTPEKRERRGPENMGKVGGGSDGVLGAALLLQGVTMARK